MAAPTAAVESLHAVLYSTCCAAPDSEILCSWVFSCLAADWERVLKTPGGLKRLPASNQVARKKRVESYGAKAITDDPMADL